PRISSILSPRPPDAYLTMTSECPGAAKVTRLGFSPQSLSFPARQQPKDPMSAVPEGVRTLPPEVPLAGSDAMTKRSAAITVLAGAVAWASAGFSASGYVARRSSTEHRWVYVNMSGQLASDAGADGEIALLRRASKAGYNGVLVEDLDVSGPRWPEALSRNARRVKSVADKLRMEWVVQVCVPYGRRIMRFDPNLAEGLEVRGARFRVSGGRARLVPETPEAQGEGRVAVTPHREYCLSAQGGKIAVSGTDGQPLAYPQASERQVIFNSQENRWVRVSGAGARAQEGGPINPIRPDGRPVPVGGEDGPPYAEGRDCQPVPA